MKWTRQFVPTDTGLKSPTNPEWRRLSVAARLAHDELERWCGRNLTGGMVAGAKTLSNPECQQYFGCNKKDLDELARKDWAVWEGSDLQLRGYDLESERRFMLRVEVKNRRRARRMSEAETEAVEGRKPPKAVAPEGGKPRSDSRTTKPVLPTPAGSALNGVVTPQVRHPAAAAAAAAADPDPDLPVGVQPTTTTTSGTGRARARVRVASTRGETGARGGGGGGEPSAREKAGSGSLFVSPETAEGFERFWAAYPKKSNRSGAETVWAELAMTPAGIKACLSYLEKRMRTRMFTRDGGDWAPQPAKWLREDWAEQLKKLRARERGRSAGPSSAADVWSEMAGRGGPA